MCCPRRRRCVIIIALMLVMLVWHGVARAQPTTIPSTGAVKGSVMVGTGPATSLWLPGPTVDGQVLVADSREPGGVRWAAPTSGPASLPSGMVFVITTGTCPAGATEATDLAGKTLVGTLAANADVGTTGGADSITPAGTVAWPVGTPTFAGSAFSAVINHTHPVAVTDPGHTHTQNSFAPRIINSGTAGTVGVQGASAASNANASNAATTATNQSNTTGITAASSNPAGGVASITPAGTVAWPAGVPTFGGTSFDNRSAFVRVIFCRVT